MKKWIAGMTMVALVAGCGQALKRTGVVDEATAVVGGGYRLMSGEPSVLPRAAAHEAAKRIGVTPEQGARLRTVARAHRNALSPADLAARKAELKAILTAPAVDADRLRGFITEAKARFEAQAPARLAAAQALRAELSPAQREQLAELVLHGGPQQAKRFAALRGRLGLTASQAAAADALLATTDQLRTDGASTRVRTALAGFVRSGESADLQTATQALVAAAPVEEAIALAASLDQRQREAIAARVEAVVARRASLR
jgi:hypothetical protein